MIITRMTMPPCAESATIIKACSNAGPLSAVTLTILPARKIELNLLQKISTIPTFILGAPFSYYPRGLKTRKKAYVLWREILSGRKILAVRVRSLLPCSQSVGSVGPESAAVVMRRPPSSMRRHCLIVVTFTFVAFSGTDSSVEFVGPDFIEFQLFRAKLV